MPLLKKSKVKLKLSKREKIFALLFLLMVVVYLYYNYVFVGQEKKIRSLERDIRSKENQIEQLTSQGYGDVSRLTDKIQAMNAEIEKIYLKVPNIKDTPGLLVKFYRSAAKNNVTAKTITFGKLESKGNYSSFTISLDVLGSRHDIINFIREIEDYPRMSRISKIEFDPMEDNMILARITDEFYVMHDVMPDPFEYSFMAGRQGQGAVTELFEHYELPERGGQNYKSSMKENMAQSTNNPVQQPGDNYIDQPVSENIGGATRYNSGRQNGK